MPDRPESNHWDALASDLGATPPPEDEKKEPADRAHEGEPTPGREEDERPQAPPEVGPSGSEKVSRQAERPKAPTDWSQLGAELGIEPPAEASFSVPDEPESAPPTELSESPALLEAVPPEPTSLWYDSTEGVAESAEDDLASADLGAELIEAADEPAETDSDPDEKKSSRRRRKRRRKPRKSSDVQSSEAAEQTAGTDSDDESAEIIGQGLVTAELPDDSAAAAPSSSDEEEAPERSKRRRRRRGSGRKEGASKKEDVPAETKAERGSSGRAEPSEAPPEIGDKPTGAKSPGAKKISAGRKKEESATEAEPTKSAKPSHRAIPTWQEAIDIVISANMEARAKSPGGGSSRSRGGRRRGGSDKSSDKAT